MTDAATLNVSDVTVYLQSLGATAVDRVRDVAEVWSLQDAEFLVPLERTLGDYARRMREIVTDLGRLQNRALEAVVQDILNVGFDLFRFRLVSAQSEDGTLPLGVGVNFVAETRELFVAAAAAAHQPRVLHPNRKPREVNEVVDAARLGQTEIGSYVVSLKNSVPPRVALGSELPEGDEPLSRKTSLILLRALRAATPLARNLELQRPVDTAQVLSQGGSANFFESLGNLFPRQIPCRLTVDVSWAAHRPGPLEEPRSLTLESVESSTWKEYGRQLRHSGPLPDYELAGPIVLLARDSDSQPRLQGMEPLGRIEVRTLIDGKLAKVHVNLSEAEYAAACQAHTEGRWVFCTGELKREGRQWRLTNPRDIRFETAGDD